MADVTVVGDVVDVLVVVDVRVIEATVERRCAKKARDKKRCTNDCA